MSLEQKKLLFALALPFVALLALMGFKAYKRFAGKELTIPIAGYDPRDLLSGHYLIYRLDIDQSICRYERRNTDPVFLCVTQEEDGVSTRVVSSLQSGDGCTAILRGKCDGSRFFAGVERFYIPEEHSRLLDKVLRGWSETRHRAKLVVSVDANGRAVVKDLLIDDQHWRDFLANTSAAR